MSKVSQEILTVSVSSRINTATDETNITVVYNDGSSFERCLPFGKINSKEKFALWLLSQDKPNVEDNDVISKTFIIAFHTELVDDGNGNLVEIRVPDSVVTEPHSYKKTKGRIEQLPGFGGTIAEGNSFIDNNVVDLVTAKNMLKSFLTAVHELKNESLKK